MPATAEDALDLLPYFGGLRPDERLRIASRVRMVNLEQGSSLSLTDPMLAIVVKGELSLVRDADRASLFPGDSVGDAEVLAGQGSSGTLTARVPSVIGLIDRPSLQAILGEYPVVAVPWVAELGRELRWRNDVLREIVLARSTGLSAARLRPILRRHQLRLRRARHHPVHRVGSLLARVLFVQPSRRPAFWVFAGLVLALVGARTVVGMILRKGMQERLFALIGTSAGNPIHVHHFNYGLLLVSLTGLLALIPRTRRALRALAFLFGVGVGLVVDEFALLWNLNPDYYQPSSRLVAALLVFALFQIVYFRSFYTSMARRLLARVFP